MIAKDAGERLKHARWAKGMSLRQLAGKAKVSTTTIVKIEKGETNVLGQVVYALADALDIPDPSALFDTEKAS